MFMNIEWDNCPAVECEAGKVSGAWVFRGTRVPLRALFENLEGGASVDDFLEWFPGVTRAQVDAVLEFVSADLVTTSAVFRHFQLHATANTCTSLSSLSPILSSASSRS